MGAAPGHAGKVPGMPGRCGACREGVRHAGIGAGHAGKVWGMLGARMPTLRKREGKESRTLGHLEERGAPGAVLVFRDAAVDVKLSWWRLVLTTRDSLGG